MTAQLSDRELGPELTAEGWIAFGDNLIWMHPPSQRVVTIEPGIKRDECYGWSIAIPCEPFARDAIGSLVMVKKHDDLGNPEWIDRERYAVWTELWGEAIRLGRQAREVLLASRPKPTAAKQFTFDDLLEAKGGPR